MQGKTNIIVAVPPEVMRYTAGRLGRHAAYMIYGVGRGFRLYRARRESAKGGYMVLDTSGFRGGGPAAAFISDILDECERMDYSGIAIDTGGGSSPAQLSLSKALASAASKNGLAYFVPEKLSDSSDDAIVRVPTALSGGTLRRHLSDAVKKYGATRVAIEVERVRMDFTLPAASGVGKALSGDALRELKERYGAAAQYSTDLAVNYFTYNDKKGAHFVLYDDSASIKNKLVIAGNTGIETAFLFYPHVADILDTIVDTAIGAAES